MKYTHSDIALVNELKAHQAQASRARSTARYDACIIWPARARHIILETEGAELWIVVSLARFVFRMSACVRLLRFAAQRIDAWQRKQQSSVRRRAPMSLMRAHRLDRGNLSFARIKFAD